MLFKAFLCFKKSLFNIFCILGNEEMLIFICPFVSLCRLSKLVLTLFGLGLDKYVQGDFEKLS